MAATIKIKNSSTASAVPTSSDLVQGELAVNVADLGLYTENASGTVVKLNAPSIDDKNTGATKHLTISTGGNLGLGVTPSAWGSIFRVQQIGAGNSFISGRTDSIAGRQLMLGTNCYYNGTNWIYGVSQPAARYYLNDNTHVWSIAPTGTAGNAITFTEAMTLDASGNLGIGTSNPTAKLYIQSDNTSGTAFRVRDGGTPTGNLLDISSNTYGQSLLVTATGNLLVGTTTVAQTLSTNHYFTIRNVSGTPWGVGPTASYGNFYVTNGGVGVYLSNGGTSWTSYSDERKKDIIEPIQNAANKVSTLRAVIGKYKTDADGVRRPFLIAQDVQAVLPEAVNTQGDDDDTLGLQYTDVIPLLVAAIKELKAEIDGLKG